jgi:hypothetical protein
VRGEQQRNVEGQTLVREGRIAVSVAVTTVSVVAAAVSLSPSLAPSPSTTEDPT